MTDWPTDLAKAIKDAIASDEPRVIIVPNETRKALAERALARMGTADDVGRITIEVGGAGNGMTSSGGVPPFTEPDTVILRNGRTMQRRTVEAIWYSLQTLFKERPLAFYELVEVARDPNHVPLGNYRKILQDYQLLHTGAKLHDGIRDVVLSAVEDDDIDRHLVPPVPGWRITAAGID